MIICLFETYRLDFVSLSDNDVRDGLEEHPYLN